jgi:hypothetical protein
MDIIMPMVHKIFGRNQQFRVAPSGVHSLYIQNGSGDMRGLHIMIYENQKIRGWISNVEGPVGSLFWEYNLGDPEALDKINGRLMEFAQTRSRDLGDTDGWKSRKSDNRAK